MVGRDAIQLAIIVLCSARASAQPYSSSYDDDENLYDDGDSSTNLDDYTTMDSSGSDTSGTYYEGSYETITTNGCVPSLIADAVCNNRNNNPWCGYDGGDCCECTCISNDFHECGYYDFDCLSPGGDKCDTSSSTDKQSVTTATTSSDTPISSNFDTYESDATGEECFPAYVGNGDCNPESNNPSCAYDGGDCCACTCVKAGYDGRCDYLNCTDPSVVDSALQCDGQLADIPFCSPGIQMEWLVETSEQALALANAVNCSDGEFNVEWRGRVVVQQTIYVGSGTTVNITGGGSSATLDGNGTTGIFSLENSSLTLSDIVVSNGSAAFGGAIAALGSTLKLYRTSFIENHATYNGGAIFALNASKVDFDGETVFFRNHAGTAGLSGHGGGMFASEDSIVTLSGPTTLADNYAGLGGGAFYVGHRTRLAWNGLTRFFANDCGSTGGALYAHVWSSVWWTGTTQFMDNSAARGGALSLYVDANVYWSGDTLFEGNSASNEGGAVFVEEGSRISWGGTTSFLNNSAQSGGAVLLTGGAHVGWSGPTLFMNNVASTDGGAVGSRAFNPDASNEISFLAIKGETKFDGNECLGNGGALAMLGLVKLSLQGRYLTFSGNSAGFGGGAVSISGTSVGPVFWGVTFELNRALFGGGVHVTGSGIDATATDDGIPNESPVSFVGCMFTGNTASSSGGAVNSASGNDLFVHSSFVGNTAKAGGALRVAGETSVENCSFVDNSSDVGGGPAVSNFGSIDQLNDSSFSRNFLNCGQGTYLAFDETIDIFSSLCDGCIECNRCYFGESPKAPKCSSLLRHSKGGEGTSTIEELEIDEGYWRATNSSTAILQCPQRDACLGGVTGAPGYCRKGYVGPYCSVCSANYAGGLGFTCTECSGSTDGIAVAAALSVVAALVLVVVIAYLFSDKSRSGTSGIVDPISKNVPLQSLKIIIVAWQIITQFFSVANTTFPDDYQTFLDGVGALNFDITWVVETGCVFDVNFHDRLVISTITPIAVIVFLGATYGLAVRVHRRSDEALEVIWQKHLSVVLLVTFLVYSAVSTVVFQTFSCDSLDDGKTYLRADYEIDCDSPEHGFFKIYAGVMIAVYPLGIPAFYTFLLVRNRALLKDELRREEASATKPTSNLWKPYKPSLFYYEVIECARRVMLTGLVVFIYPNTAAQIALTLVMAFIFAIVSEVLRPYLSRWDAWLNRIAQVTVFLSMYLALLLKVDVSGEGADSQRMFEIVLIAAHVLMIFVVVVEAGVLAHALRTQVKRQEEPQPVRSSSVTSILEIDEPL